MTEDQGQRTIIDVHTHVWDRADQLGPDAAARLRTRFPDPLNRPDASIDAYGRAMAPVRRGIILGFVSRFLEAEISAEQVAGFVQTDPERYIGFTGIDPMADSCLDDLEQAVELGLRGVCLSPSAQDFHPTHTRAMRLYERCHERHLPILFHPGYQFAPTAKLEFGDPVLFDEVARSFPGLKMVIAQVGHPWVEQTLVLVGKHPNLFADLSDVVLRPWQLYNVLLHAHQQDVIGHLLLGSDFPFCTPERAITTIYSINRITQGTALPTVPREQLRSIVERDALACLGLDDDGPEGRPAMSPPPAEAEAGEIDTPAPDAADTGTPTPDPEAADAPADSEATDDETDASPSPSRSAVGR